MNAADEENDVIAKGFKNCDDVLNGPRDLITNLQLAVFYGKNKGHLVCSLNLLNDITGKIHKSDKPLVGVKELMMFALPAVFEASVTGALMLMKKDPSPCAICGYSVTLNDVVDDSPQSKKIYFTVATADQKDHKVRRLELVAHMTMESESFAFIIAFASDD
jgi:hypothetical protein